VISIAAARDGAQWRFDVRDNGIGIEPQYIKQLFQVFKRLHSADEYPGTGIGLAVCRKIVERHGGRIWIESVLGEGSSFIFTLPAMETQS
jgi:light-regulated signal transduction histidine kinase (bacteriophytochrome)